MGRLWAGWRRRAAPIARLGLCCALLLAGLTLGARPGQAQRAALAAHAFYAISAHAYETWCRDPRADHCPPPARVIRFPARVQYVGFYFATDFPAKHAGDMLTATLARFSITIRTSAGVLYTRYANLVTGTEVGWQESTASFGDGFALIHAPQIAQDMSGSVYPDDIYRADLLIDGRPAAHTTFSVGSGRPAHATRLHPTIVAFYPTTEVAYSTWTDTGTVPARVRTVQGGAQVFFYMRWSNTPTTTPLSIGIWDPAQRALVAHSGLFTVPRTNGYAMYIVVTPDSSPFNPGAYQGEVLLGDQVLAKVAFIIGG